MKTVYVGIFFAGALLLFIGAVTTIRLKTYKAAHLRKVLLCSSLATLANAVVAAAEESFPALVGFTFCSIGTMWALFFFWEFCIIYTTKRLQHTFLHKIALIVLSIDSISYIANLFFQHAFTVIQITGANGAVYFRRTPFLAGGLHLGLCYLLLLLSFIVIIRRMIAIPSIYWGRYILVLAFSLVALVCELAFLLFNTKINFTAIGFVTIAPLLTYFSLYHKPRLIIDRLLKRVVDISDDLVFFFDVDHTCIYANEKARAFFGIQDNTLFLSGTLITDWLSDTDFTWQTVSGTYICTRIWNGQTTHLKICYAQLRKSKKTVGSSFHIHDITAEVLKYEVQHYTATHDSLTKLYNREYLFQRIHHELMLHPETDYYLFVSDIKGFKLINDIFGRSIGDDVLIRSAKIMREHLKDTALYGRIGNDRFCILLTKPQLETIEFKENQERISRILPNSYYPVIVHGGIYPITNRNLPVSTMVDYAYIALASIKNSHEQRTAFYTEEMRQGLLWEQQITAELDDALKEHQFELYLQPQADRHGAVKGAEVLIRWNHPEKGLLSPNLFIQVLEKNGLITKLDMYVWEEAAKLLKKWKEAGHADFYLSVNLSPNDFYYIDVNKTFTELAAKYDIEPNKLKLEITETVMITDLAGKVQLIHQLHESGFAVEMDDFGSGYSSLNVLKDIPVDVLKIDMAFLSNAENKQRSQIIIEQIITLSKELGIPVITEGVETEEQVAFLRDIGCEMYQGYYFAQPLPVAEFEKQYINKKQDSSRVYA